MRAPKVPEELSKEIQANIPSSGRFAVIRILEGIRIYGERCFKRGGIGPVGMPVGTCKNCGKKCRVCSAELCTNRAYMQHPEGPPAERCPEWKSCDHKRLILSNHTICSDYDTHCRKKS